ARRRWPQSTQTTQMIAMRTWPSACSAWSAATCRADHSGDATCIAFAVQLHYNGFMEEQLTLRLPRELARRLAQRARAAGVKRSMVVREALAAYLAVPAVQPPARSVQERIGKYIGSVTLDRAAIERDEMARRIREHNWRE
ncbi:MAG: ribbon-helix-helix protein, CopG family, partial [Gemmatimonadales bacterium]